ncbi:MAG: hypothetical protein FWD95_10360 [Nocardioidaceae bacterium]|nr:hypothetical protein [Nocardioidaceae bacterium]
MGTAVGIAVGVIAIIGAIVAAARWIVGRIEHGLVRKIDDTVAAQVGPRFAQIDRRFEQIDRRFEQIDRRFEQIDRRFEQMDARFDHLESKMDHGFAMTEVRLKHLEGDMVLVKQHLLGNAA